MLESITCQKCGEIIGDRDWATDGRCYACMLENAMRRRPSSVGQTSGREPLSVQEWCERGRYGIHTLRNVNRT